MGNLILLHIGCANKYHEGFINSDYVTEHNGVQFKVDEIMDITKPWPYANESVDGIVSMHVLQQIYWRDLIFALQEAKRVLKKGGVMRFGCPMIDIEYWTLHKLLGWKNINLFSVDLLRQVFKRLGFKKFRQRGWRKSYLHELTYADNREGRATLYFDVIK
jgi:SAM-dependent methyltransferase